jgi:hypothetical protein
MGLPHCQTFAPAKLQAFLQLAVLLPLWSSLPNSPEELRWDLPIENDLRAATRSGCCRLDSQRAKTWRNARFLKTSRAPVIARALHSSGHEANQKALTALVRKAQAQGLVQAGDPAVLAARYFAVLSGDLMIRLLMRVREAPTEREIKVRARAAAETLMAFP